MEIKKMELLLTEKSQFSEVEKDYLKQLHLSLANYQLIGFYWEYKTNPKLKLKSLAADYGIKASWAQIALDIGAKLVYRQLKKAEALAKLRSTA